MVAGPKVTFHIERWAFWRANSPGAKAEVPEMPALLRRRASPAVRAALRVAFDCVGVSGNLPAVFCSRHGEVQRSVELLNQMLSERAVSPMAFSLSVHNAAAALYSLTRVDTKPMSAISAGRDSLPQGIFEAAGLLASGEQNVLVVAYDDALPPDFAPFRDEDDVPHALGLWLQASGPKRYALELLPGSAAASHLPHTLQVAQFLQEKSRELSVNSAPRRWLWRRDD